jgi:hypothetical protein
VETSEFRPSKQYIFLRVIPSCLRFAKMCLCQVSLLLLGDLHTVYMDQEPCFPSCSESDVDPFWSVSFRSSFLNQFYTRRLIGWIYEILIWDWLRSHDKHFNYWKFGLDIRKYIRDTQTCKENGDLINLFSGLIFLFLKIFVCAFVSYKGR